MIIYLEGVDGSGKSTLATKLYKKLRLLLTGEMAVHNDMETTINTNPRKPNRLNYVELINVLTFMADDKTNLYILDRGPISDVVYQLFGTESPLLSLSECLGLMSALGKRVILIHCNPTNAYELMKARGDDNPVALKNHKLLSNIYNMIMPSFKPITYDFNTDSFNDLTKNIYTTLTKLTKLTKVKGGLK